MQNTLFRRPKCFCMILFLIVLVIFSTWVLHPPTVGAGGAPGVGIHLGNQPNLDWTPKLFEQIDARQPGGRDPEVVVVLSDQVYQLQLLDPPDCGIIGVRPNPTRPKIAEYLRHLADSQKKVLIRINPSPGNFDDSSGRHRLQVDEIPGRDRCDRRQSRSASDIAAEIYFIHEVNKLNGINEWGFRPANEPNTDWYQISGRPIDPYWIHDDAWLDMELYFHAIYSKVHALSADTELRVLTPPMSQNNYGEKIRVTPGDTTWNCAEMLTSPYNRYGYTDMSTVFWDGSANNGYAWHNYFRSDYASWFDCNQHVSYNFPVTVQYWVSAKKQGPSPQLSFIAEADLASTVGGLQYTVYGVSPPAVHSNKDDQNGTTAAKALGYFIREEQIADYVAVWNLNIYDPGDTSIQSQEQHWHEAYKSEGIAPNRTDTPRPWWTCWWPNPYNGCGPTAVTISDFSAQGGSGQITINWTTANEWNNLGFNLWRSTSPDGTYFKLNANIIPSKCTGCIVGASYVYTDLDVGAGKTYFYKLESVDINGISWTSAH